MEINMFKHRKFITIGNNCIKLETVNCAELLDQPVNLSNNKLEGLIISDCNASLTTIKDPCLIKDKPASKKNSWGVYRALYEAIPYLWIN